MLRVLLSANLTCIVRDRHVAYVTVWAPILLLQKPTQPVFFPLILLHLCLKVNMQPNSLAPRGPPRGVDALVEALLRVIPQGGLLTAGAVVVAETYRRAVEVLKRHIHTLISSAFIAAGLTALLPSLAVVIVNAVGFTAAGVAKGLSYSLTQIFAIL